MGTVDAPFFQWARAFHINFRIILGGTSVGIFRGRTIWAIHFRILAIDIFLWLINNSQCRQRGQHTIELGRSWWQFGSLRGDRRVSGDWAKDILSIPFSSTSKGNLSQAPNTQDTTSRRVGAAKGRFWEIWVARHETYEFQTAPLNGLLTTQSMTWHTPVKY